MAEIALPGAPEAEVKEVYRHTACSRLREVSSVPGRRVLDVTPPKKKKKHPSVAGEPAPGETPWSSLPP